MIREAPIQIEPKPLWEPTAPAASPQAPPRSFRLDATGPLGEALRETMLAQLEGAIAASTSLPKLDDPIERAAAAVLRRPAQSRERSAK